MSIAVSIALTPESQRFLATLQQAPARMQQAILRVIDRENLYTVGEIQERRLSRRGPDTLGVITDRLRGSIRAAKAVLGGGGEIVSSIGSNVSYAGAHEFGFDGEVTVRAHTRRVFEFMKGSKTTLIFDMKTGLIKRPGKTTRRKTTGEVQVRQHQRHMRVPERAFIRRTLERRAGQYTAAIGQAVTDLLNG